MTNEQLRMQFLSGVITEGQYKAKLKENKDKSSLNEGMIGGIVGVGAITQIPPRAKTDYETAFEHFLGERYETKFENREQDPYTMEEDLEEAKMGNIDPAIKNNPAFNKLVSYLKTHPDEAEELKDKEDKIEDVLQNVNEAFKKDGKFYTQDTYGNTKEVDFKTYLKDKGISVAMSAAALGFLGALMAGALGTNTPNEILDAVLVASGIGAAAGATLGEGEEIEEGNNDLFTAKRFYKRTDNPRINILSNLNAIDDIVMDMETDLVKGYGPDERDDIYREYMKFVNAIRNLVK
jgi:hypothetical protein